PRPDGGPHMAALFWLYVGLAAVGMGMGEGARERRSRGAEGQESLLRQGDKETRGQGGGGYCYEARGTP
ncbi:MAG: hypothetical protein QHJ81_14335, partial [Anaerolineae bacterium]|nr:hypothetical protein [Anaerolineae bacterium]